MTNTTPTYDPYSNLKRNVLEAFFRTGPGSLEKMRQSGNSAYLGNVAAFIDLLRRFGVLHSHVNVEDCAIFRHEGIATAIESFIRANPASPLPLENITLVKHVSAGKCSEDLKNIALELRQNLDRMERFARQFNIEVCVHVFVKAFNARQAASVAALANTNSIDLMRFILNAPATDPRSTQSLISALRRFLDDPASRNPKVRLGNFPFCFLPPDRFKDLYKDAISSLKGRVILQRKLLKKLAGTKTVYHKQCETCRCRIPCYAYTDIVEWPQYGPSLSPRHETTLCFIGGSLGRTERPHAPDIVYVSPAEQGDMLAAVLEGFDNILVVDGYFDTRFPCTPFEIALALEQGINVLGASSIGALRAIELENYGMRGMGYVFEYLKRQNVKPYHVVAQTYGEDDVPRTVPLINVIRFLELALNDHVIERAAFQRCLATAENIHFPELSFALFFRKLAADKRVGPDRVAALKTYMEAKGIQEFNVKKHDALLLLNRFRSSVAGSGRDGNTRSFTKSLNNTLMTLYGKYDRDHNLSLPRNWRSSARKTVMHTGARRDNRIRTPAETCRLAARFFSDLGITVADTSRYDPSGNSIISAFFVPFYSLDYPVSCASGNGKAFGEALASAYMELVERIPMCGFHIKPLEALGGAPFPQDLVPQYYNWAETPRRKKALIEREGYVLATDIVSGRNVFVPKLAVMSRYSGSDGNAAGNSLEEAILYGIYELVERDTNQMHLLTPEFRRRKTEFLVDNNTLADKRCRELLGQFKARDCEVFLFSLPNVYGLPCITTNVFDQRRRIQCHGSSAVRSDLYSAIYAALHEAYMQHITYFAGTRDDYVSPFDSKEAQIAYENARLHLFCERGFPAARKATVASDSLSAELKHVIDRLTGMDIRHILVADTSPREASALKSVKVIIPRMELWFCPAYTPSQFLEERSRMTVSAIRSGPGLSRREPSMRRASSKLPGKHDRDGARPSKRQAKRPASSLEGLACYSAKSAKAAFATKHESSRPRERCRRPRRN